jgi:multidrug efflux system membrane fusion protein
LAVAVGFAGDEGHPHVAKLDLIEPEVDPATGTARFRATVPNPKGLFSPGMSARVRLTPAPK